MFSYSIHFYPFGLCCRIVFQPHLHLPFKVFIIPFNEIGLCLSEALATPAWPAFFLSLRLLCSSPRHWPRPRI